MRKSTIIFLSCALTIAFVLIGCSDSDVTDDERVEVNEEQKIDEEVSKNGEQIIEKKLENPALNRKNTLTVAASSLNGLFNPVIANSESDLWVAEAIFDPLVKYNKKGIIDNNAIAKDWEISEDGLTYTFYLNEGVKFHDGEELTSNDVAFTYYTIADSKFEGNKSSIVDDIVGVNAYREGYVDTIQGIEIIDDYSIAFRIESPDVNKLHDFNCGIIPEHYYSYNSWDEFISKLDMPMGSGILKFVKYEDNNYIEMEKNSNYYKETSKVDNVIISVIPIETQPIALAKGDVDIANSLPNMETYEIITDTGIANVIEVSSDFYRYIGLNLRKEKFDDVRVRQALAYGIRMNEFIESEWKGFAKPIYYPILPDSQMAPDENNIDKYEYNIEKAQDLLAEAGWIKNSEGLLVKEGEQFNIKWLTYSESQWPFQLIKFAENNWGELGITIDVQVLDFEEFYTRVFKLQDFDVWNMSWSLPKKPNFYDYFHSDSSKHEGFNAGGFVNQKSDQLIEDALKEHDQNERSNLYKSLGELINKELPYIFVSMDIETWGVNNRVKNMELNPFCSWVDNLENIELKY